MAMSSAAYAAALAALAAQFKAGSINQAQYATELKVLNDDANSAIPVLGGKIDDLIARADLRLAAVAAFAIKGVVTNIADLPAEAEEGDSYKLLNAEDDADKHVFVRVVGAWEDFGEVVGPAGQSAYELAVATGAFVGTAEEYAALPVEQAAAAEAAAAEAVAKAAAADAVRAETVIVKDDTLEAKSLTEAATAAANAKIGETEAVRAATVTVKDETLDAKALTEAATAAANEKIADLDALRAIGVKGVVTSAGDLPDDAELGDAYRLINPLDEHDGHLFVALPAGWVDLGKFQGEDGLGLKPWATISSDFDAIMGARLICDSSAAPFTVTLPADGGDVWLRDLAGSFAAHAVTIAGNGRTLDGEATLSADRARTELHLTSLGDVWEIIFNDIEGVG